MGKKEKKEKKKKKSKLEQKVEEEKIAKIVKRLESNERVQERVKIDARLIPSPPDQEGVNVKIKLNIIDNSFYAKSATVYFNAGTESFENIIMEKVDMDNFAVVLGNIPKEIQVVYYIKILDKSGEFQQFPRVELIQSDGTSEEEPYFSFSVEPSGAISFKKDWDDTGLVNCRVCGYACIDTWDTCPECRTPLYDTFQEVFLDDQKAKIDARKMKKEEEPSWDDASDEAWRSLPECPNCGYTVQMEWEKCPVCQLDLDSVELKKKVSYEEFMSEEEKEEAAEMSEIKKRKKAIKSIKDKTEEEEPDWDDQDGIDIL